MSLQPRTSRGMPRMPAHACPIVCRGTLWVFVFLVCFFFFLGKKNTGVEASNYEFFFVVTPCQNFGIALSLKKKSVFLQRLKFSWIFGVLRAIEEVGRPHFLERRFDFQKFWVLKKRVFWSFFAKKAFWHNWKKNKSEVGPRCFFF